MKKIWFFLFLTFTVVPAVELYALFWIGSRIGATATVLLILLTGTLGASLAKVQGVAVLRQIASELGQGLPPATRLVEGLLVLIGAVLLITPGVFTDLTGLLLLVPPVRRALAPAILRGVSRYFVGVSLGGVQVGAPEPVSPSEPTAREPSSRGPFHHPVR